MAGCFKVSGKVVEGHGFHFENETVSPGYEIDLTVNRCDQGYVYMHISAPDKDGQQVHMGVCLEPQEARAISRALSDMVDAAQADV